MTDDEMYSFEDLERSLQDISPEDRALIIEKAYEFAGKQEEAKRLSEEKEKDRNHECEMKKWELVGTAITAIGSAFGIYFSGKFKTEQTKAILDSTSLSAFDKRTLLENLNPKGFFRSLFNL